MSNKAEILSPTEDEACNQGRKWIGRAWELESPLIVPRAVKVGMNQLEVETPMNGLHYTIW